MKTAAIMTVAALALLLATSAPANARRRSQDEHHAAPKQEHQNNRSHGRSSAPRPDKQQATSPQAHHERQVRELRVTDRRPEKPRHAEPAKHPRPEVRHERQVRELRVTDRRPEKPRHAAPARHPRPEVRHERRVVAHDVWQRDRARNWKREHRTWHARGGYHGYRIPQARFRAHFGRAHWFRVHSVPIIVVNGHPRFQYAGFWFSLVDPWPQFWASTWYETDDVCIDYVNDGYYLYNRRHPGVAIAVSVSF
jgi:hypothetical protein